VLVKRQRVDHQGVAEQVHVLAGVPDAVGPVEVQRVLQAPVDGPGVAPSAVDLLEVRIARRDRPEVLDPVELRAASSSLLYSRTTRCLRPWSSGRTCSLYHRNRSVLSCFREVRIRRSSTKYSFPLSVGSPRREAIIIGQSDAVVGCQLQRHAISRLTALE
jgi:hypothetical protein